ncbi:MAG: hypothetical protein QM774_05820 [Gordonia sp. (in: high G+C Gram-positive bacteria)]|uniref:LppM family (lipo)protein n=1 Tax=Gordonia sp. (in: high G+C Gram-positive bacteria) TaxID=84139 RepID=UPI0039E51D0A
MPSISPRPAGRPSRRIPAWVAVALLALVPLLAGCTKSVNVGDQFSGFVVVAASPDAGTTPTFDVPASMSGSVQVTPYPAANGSDGDQTGQNNGQDTKSPSSGKTGSRLTFTDLTAGQFSQLGDIVSTALDSGATVDLTANRSGDIVRLRGGAALAGLNAATYYISINVDFTGPVVSSNGNPAGDDSVSWNPEPGQNVQFIADAKYPDPATAAMPSWTTFVVLLCGLIIAAVAWLAYRFRDTSSPRYVPPKPESAPSGPGGETATGKPETEPAS